MKTRVLIVDDEPLARDRIRHLLGGWDDFEVCGECGDGKAAVEAIARLRPDIVLLDVRMPEMDGFEVVDTVGVDRMPVVVFVTAYDEFALAAFERHAVGYLLKPVDRERFRCTMERAAGWVRARRVDEGGSRLAELLAELRARQGVARRFAVKTPTGIALVRVDEIRWISAARNYVELHTSRGTHLLRRTLQQVETELDPERFLRIHRSTIVHIDRVREIQPLFKGDQVVILDDGTELPLGRAYRDRVAGLLGSSG